MAFELGNCRATAMARTRLELTMVVRPMSGSSGFLLNVSPWYSICGNPPESMYSKRKPNFVSNCVPKDEPLPRFQRLYLNQQTGLVVAITSCRKVVGNGLL